jgi:hypothetical protein
MKEVLTKRFWKDVKRTFDEALEGPPAKVDDQNVAAEIEANENSEPGAPAKEDDASPGLRGADIK